MRITTIVVVMGMFAALASPRAWADDVHITVPPPGREPHAVAPGPIGARRPGDEYVQPGPVVPYDPAFVPPFVVDVQTPDSTGRLGLSGWTSPNTPVGPSGAGLREINGWLVFGFTWTWGGPPSRPREAGMDPSSLITR